MLNSTRAAARTTPLRALLKRGPSSARTQVLAISQLARPSIRSQKAEPPNLARLQPSSSNWGTKTHLLPSLHRLYSSEPPQTLADPTRPDLFYHLVSLPSSSSSAPPTQVYAVSFLSSSPPTPDSASVIGWLPAETEGAQEQDAGLNDFRENSKFRVVMHRAIQEAIREEADDVLKNGALQLQYGWMHIHDSRNIPALGRIGDPDDIIASVLVEDSKILPDTYQAMPSYRICTADGPTQLTEGLAQKLKTLLEQIVSQETK